jgi:hypothetical protein
MSTDLRGEVLAAAAHRRVVVPADAVTGRVHRTPQCLAIDVYCELIVDTDTT